MDRAGLTHTFHRLHDGPEPFVLVNAWDVGSALVLIDAGFPAIGTTSLGVNASHGLPDAAGASRAANLALATTLATLPVPVTLDIEDAYSTDPDEVADLAAELFAIGIAGVNVEDGRAGRLADPAEMTAVVAALKRGAPDLFVNARVDAHWLKVDTDQTEDRARAYADAGADGIFVPGLADEAEIARLVAAIDQPLNLLAQLPLATMRELGVRRVSTGSLLYRAAMDAILDAARSVRDGGVPPVRTSYDDVERLV